MVPTRHTGPFIPSSLPYSESYTPIFFVVSENTRERERGRESLTNKTQFDRRYRIPISPWGHLSGYTTGVRFSDDSLCRTVLGVFTRTFV